MSAVHKLPVEYTETQTDPQEPVVTLLHSELSHAYLEDAEPSPIMGFFSRLWYTCIRTLKWAFVILLVGGYPVAMIASHEINSEPVVLSQADAWAAPNTGVLLTLIGRELTGPGWADDRAPWHPQAHLTALPAWQNGVMAALSDYTALAAQQVQNADGSGDQDLLAASRLLAPASDVDAIPRLNAASEALQSYDSRLARDMAISADGMDPFLAQIALFKKWNLQSSAAIRENALTLDGWPASRKDISAVYAARAHAHVASQMLIAAIANEPTLIVTRDASDARNTLLLNLRRMADFNPLFVSNQGATSLIFADHLASLAFYSSETQAAFEAFEAALLAQPADPVAFAARATPAP